MVGYVMEEHLAPLVHVMEEHLAPLVHVMEEHPANGGICYEGTSCADVLEISTPFVEDMALETRRGSLTSVHSSDSSFIEDIFGHDDTDEDYEENGDGKGKSIFTVGLRCSFLDLVVRVALCVSYVVRVCLDDVSQYECKGFQCSEKENSTTNERDSLFAESDINWYVLLWVHRNMTIWVLEVSLALFCLFKTLMFVIIARKGHRLEQILTVTFFLEILCDIPILATNDLHLTKRGYQTISVTLMQQMILLFVNITCLLFTTICTIQHIQRGSNGTNFTIFEAFYFVVVTFSTVGYGDFSPDIWLGRLFMILTIALAFVTLPSQIQGILATYMERVNSGGDYSRGLIKNKRHVIVCTTNLTQESLIDFLNEFYSNPGLEDRHVILLCPHDLDSSKLVILKDPKWSNRVRYIKGSALKDVDLMRCCAKEAYACFFLAARPTQNKAQADRHTILRSWAVKDYAPNCKQYVYLFSASNKIHLNFVDHVVCEDELSYALLANNCLYPGLSTLVSLLVHSQRDYSGPREHWQQMYGWHAGNEIHHIQLQKSIFFGHCIGFTFPQASADAHHRFGVALLAVIDSECLPLRLQLNPGPHYKLKPADICFYMSMTKEQNSQTSRKDFKNSISETKPIYKAHMIQRNLVKSETSFMQSEEFQNVFDNITNLMGAIPNSQFSTGKYEDPHLQRPESSPDDSNNFDSTKDKENSTACEEKSEKYLRSTSNSSSAPLLNSSSSKEAEDGLEVKDDERFSGYDYSLDNDIASSEVGRRHEVGNILQFYENMEQDELITDLPPVTFSSGFGKTVCHVRKNPRPLCCLEWGTDCKHCSYKRASDPRWQNHLVILLAEHASGGIFNFIIPLRSAFIGLHAISPIVLLLEDKPDALFLDTLAHFPLVYYMTGRIWSIDDLLLAGINRTSHLVVINRDPDSNYDGEEFLEDSATIVAVQKIFRLFPSVTILTELSQTSNMRFMNFSPMHYPLHNPKHKSSPHMDDIFHLPFAGGHVFSASMLDTLLYQTFSKGYLISFIRLLLGIDGEQGSGHLSSILVKKSSVRKFQVYGNLYEALCRQTGEIPFAIYRTLPATNSELFGINLPQIITEPVNEKKPSNETKFGCPKLNPAVNVHGHRRFSAICQPQVIDLSTMIKERVLSLKLSTPQKPDSDKTSISFIINNPAPNCKLIVGDIVYVIQPSSMCATPSHLSKMYKYNVKSGHKIGPNESTPKMSRL
ncbi:potassium channel, sub T, member 2 [Bulinus truncatus]|nr:potassium channel, sub T, member 2 [Bulinus truncatus]